MKKIQLQKYNDVRGNLTFFQNNDQIPFKIERTYWIYDVSGGEAREGHAFKKSEEFIIALSGSFDIEITKQGVNKTFKLSRPFYGIYIPNDDLVLNKINDNINIQICSIYGNEDMKIKNDIIECEFVEDKLKPKNMDDFKKNDIISINSKHFTKIIDIVEDSLVLEKLPLELEESIYIMNMNLQNTLVFR